MEVLLQAQKQVIRYDVEEMKLKLKPVKDALEFVKKITTRDKTNLLLAIGSDIAINTFVKNFILSRAGWLTKTIIPFFFEKLFLSFYSRTKR